MLNLKNVLMLVGCVACLSFASESAVAQNTPSQNTPPQGGGRRNFDPAQMRQRRLDSIRDQMEIKDDAEWKLISDKIGKVMEAQMEVLGGMMRMGRPRSSDSNSQGGGRRGFFGAEPSAELQALEKAIDSKASSDELKAKLAKVRSELKLKEAKLEKAQEDLRGVLTVRQESIAVVNGVLK